MTRHPLGLGFLVFATFVSCTASPIPLAPSNPCALSRAVSADAIAADEEGMRPNNLRVLLGVRALDDDTYWGTLDSQGLLGLDYARVADGKGFGFELGASRSEVTKDVVLLGIPVSIKGAVAELWGGVHYRSPIGDSPFVAEGGLGPAFVFAQQDVQVPATSTAVRVDGTAPGVYAHAGIGLYVSRAVSVGLDVHWLWTGELNLDSGSVKASGGNADSITGTLAFGLHF